VTTCKVGIWCVVVRELVNLSTPKWSKQEPQIFNNAWQAWRDHLREFTVTVQWIPKVCSVSLALCPRFAGVLTQIRTRCVSINKHIFNLVVAVA